MNLVFLDTIPWDYDVATPFEQPLGGSLSALGREPFPAISSAGDKLAGRQ